MIKEKRKNALLEIGTDELPARFISPALAQLRSITESILQANGLEFEKINILGTPRRLSVLIQGISGKARDQENIVVGPPPNVAKNEQNEWTPVALGFAKAQKLPVDKLQIKETPKGPRLVAIHHVKGQPAESLLKQIFPDIIQKLNFPKNMVWEPSRFKFARPIRWIAALYGNNVVKFKLADVQSDKNTYGLLALGAQKITISAPEKYQSLLKGRCILVDPEERKQNILKQVETIAKRLKASVLTDDVLLDEVIQLTEYPTAIMGQFDERYLNLPREILISVLRKHQKFFPVESQKGKLSNHFIGVRNGLSDHQETVREGYERVLAARLADAQFFFEHDTQVKLEILAPQLSGVGFHEKLGSLWDKVQRVINLVEKIAVPLSLHGEQLENARRAALLSKADLLTQIVGEFPELQGVAGRFYGEKQEKTAVATAIEQHHWPLTADGAIPSTLESALVAVADKIDTLAANFSVGLIPTGSADPYALRRASIGVLRILVDQKWDVSLQTLIDKAFETLNQTKGKKELEDFFIQRIHAWYENQGYRSDEVDAVASNLSQSMAVVQEKLQELKTIRGRPEFESISAAIKRANNLLKQAREKGWQFISDHSFENEQMGEPETALNAAINFARPRLTSALESRNYHGAFMELSPLKKPIDDFFNGVMIMVDDEKLRTQRLGLLLNVKNLFDAVADFSKLQA